MSNPFQSNAFAANPYASYPFRGVLVPVPPIGGGGESRSGGWGGGKGLHVEELPSDVWGVDAETTTLVTVLAKKLTDSDAISKRLRTDTLRPKRPAPEYDLKLTIHDLRGRVTSLEDALNRANQATMLPWRLYTEAVAEIGRLRAAIIGVEAEQARMASLIEAQQRAIAELESHRHDVLGDPDAGILYNIPVVGLPSFDEVWAKAFGDAPSAPAPIARAVSFPWAEVAASAGVSLITIFALPGSWKRTRAFGYGVASAIAFAAIKKLLA